jgi:hypothetical protein
VRTARRSESLSSSWPPIAAPNPRPALADAPPDDVLDAVEGAGADEQDVGRVDLDELLLRPVARAIGRDGRGLALEDLEQGLLHALARTRRGWCDGAPPLRAILSISSMQMMPRAVFSTSPPAARNSP